MLKLKLQYLGHLMKRTDSFEKTLMLGKIEGRRRRGRQRMRWLGRTTALSNSVKLSHARGATQDGRQSCPTLCDPINSSPPGSSVPGILQARILEWVALVVAGNKHAVV